MSEDKRQLARTQGRFFQNENDNYKSRKSDPESWDKKKQNDEFEKQPSAQKKSNPKYHGSDKNQKITSEKRGNSKRSRHSDEFSPIKQSESAFNVKYEETSSSSVHEVPFKRAEVISKSGEHILSKTENGESKIFYMPDFLAENEAFDLFDTLKENVKWSKKNIVINGTSHPQPRLVAWFGPLPYSYSGVTLEPKDFPDVILNVKERIVDCLQVHNINADFNSVLLNLYRDGKDSVAWHSDDESSMGIHPTIASVSLGEVRRFEMRRKPPIEERPSKAEAEYVVYLEHGSLIIMDGVMQTDWEHRVPKEYHDKDARINLTFRTVYPVERIPRSYPKYLKSSGEMSLNENNYEKAKPFEFNDEMFPSLNEINSTCIQNKNELETHQSNKSAKDKFINSNDNFSISNNDEKILESDKSQASANIQHERDSLPTDDPKSQQSSYKSQEQSDVYNSLHEVDFPPTDHSPSTDDLKSQHSSYKSQKQSDAYGSWDEDGFPPTDPKVQCSSHRSQKQSEDYESWCENDSPPIDSKSQHSFCKLQKQSSTYLEHENDSLSTDSKPQHLSYSSQKQPNAYNSKHKNDSPPTYSKPQYSSHKPRNHSCNHNSRHENDLLPVDSMPKHSSNKFHKQSGVYSQYENDSPPTDAKSHHLSYGSRKQLSAYSQHKNDSQRTNSKSQHSFHGSQKHSRDYDSWNESDSPPSDSKPLRSSHKSQNQPNTFYSQHKNDLPPTDSRSQYSSHRSQKYWRDYYPKSRPVQNHGKYSGGNMHPLPNGSSSENKGMPLVQQQSYMQDKNCDKYLHKNTNNSINKAALSSESSDINSNNNSANNVSGAQSSVLKENKSNLMENEEENSNCTTSKYLSNRIISESSKYYIDNSVNTKISQCVPDQKSMQVSNITSSVENFVSEDKSSASDEVSKPLSEKPPPFTNISKPCQIKGSFQLCALSSKLDAKAKSFIPKAFNTEKSNQSVNGPAFYENVECSTYLLENRQLTHNNNLLPSDANEHIVKLDEVHTSFPNSLYEPPTEQQKNEACFLCNKIIDLLHMFNSETCKELDLYIFMIQCEQYKSSLCLNKLTHRIKEIRDAAIHKNYSNGIVP